MTRSFIVALVVCAGLAGFLPSPQARAQAPAGADKPFLHALFTDHMVFPRDREAPVWGWTTPGAKVTVSMNGKSASAVAGTDGRWQAKLGPFEAGGPHALTVAGPQSVTVNDVLVGDVWICSGQSNMEWSVGGSNNAQHEIADANHPKIRLFTVPKRISFTPQENVSSQWQVCSPATVGGFSAVGYFFGRELQQKAEVPIGLIHTSWGGTVAEAWTSAEALSTMEDFAGSVQAFRQQVAAQADAESNLEKLMAKWWADNDPGSQGDTWASLSAEVNDWKKMKLPVHWENAGLPEFDGVVWFRTEVTVPDQLAGKPATLSLGPIDDRDTTFLNGERIGGMEVWDKPRAYKVPAKLLKAGKNVIAVRVLDTGGGGGICGQPGQLKLEIQGADAISLAGDWQYKASAPLNQLKPAPQALTNNPNVVTVLYNGMLAPLVPFSVKGAIWYQGESNAGRAMQYRTLLPTMIKDWRTRFGVGEFPFIIVQLANFLAVQKNPAEPGWAELREAQWLTARNDPNTGLAVAIDIGDEKDIHPRNKQDVGKRLALQALQIAYEKDIVHAGPDYREMTVKDGKAVIHFDNVGGGLVAKGEKLTGFAIAGADGQFHWADATIEGDTVVLSPPQVASPVAVRYNWANNPIGNLYNKEGLPAGPFRTDVDAK